MVRLTIGVALLQLLASTNPAGLLGFIFLQEASLALVLVFTYLFPLVLLVNYGLRLIALAIRKVQEFRKMEAVCDGQEPKREFRRWAALPTCVLLGISVYLTQWPLKARFMLSRDAMEQEARNILSVTSQPANPNDFEIEHVAIDRWIGLFRVSVAKVDTKDRTVELILDGNAFIWWGFMYDPNQVRTAPDGMTVAPGWFGYVELK